MTNMQQRQVGWWYLCLHGCRNVRIMDPICTTMFIPDSIKNYITLWALYLLVNQLDTCSITFNLVMVSKLILNYVLFVFFCQLNVKVGKKGGKKEFKSLFLTMGLSVHILVTNARHCDE